MKRKWFLIVKDLWLTVLTGQLKKHILSLLEDRLWKNWRDKDLKPTGENQLESH